ncbi:hypothetical protein ABPG74_005224 [Tetrahymena malaccensis]
MNHVGNHINMYDQPQQIFLNNNLHRMHKSNELLTNNINFNYSQIGQEGLHFLHQQQSIPQQSCSDMQGIYEISNNLSSLAQLESQQSTTYDRNSFSHLQQTPTSFKTQNNASISNNIFTKLTPLSNLNELESQVMQTEEILTFQNVQLLEIGNNNIKQEQQYINNENNTEQLEVKKKKSRQSQKQISQNEQKYIKKENSNNNDGDSHYKLHSNNSMSSSKSSIKNSKQSKFEQNNLNSIKKSNEQNKQSLIQCNYKLLPVIQNEQILAEQENCSDNDKPLQVETNQIQKQSNEKQQLQNQQANQEFNSNTNINQIYADLNLQSSQNEILNKIQSGKPCSESKIIKKFQLSDALQFVKQSIFNQKKETVFEQKNLTPFKLRQSNLKNDEIVFAQIKESRRNNRLNKKGDEQLKFKGDGTCQDPEIVSDQDEDDDSSINKQSSSLKQKTINGKTRKATSKFHNLKKLFMYKLIATFNMSNMIDIGVPVQVREAILKLMVKFKLSAKKSEEFNRKTEFFSQAHYNALFLHLTPKTITALSQNKFEVYLHKLIFQIDLEKIAHYINNPQLKNNNTCQSTQIEIETDQFSDCFRNHSVCCYEERIQYINILKRYCYQIVKNSNMFGINDQPENKSNQDNEAFYDEQLQIQNQDKQLNEQENMRMAYTFRALQGISNLNKGLFVKKF